jgi:hypothetical protein
MRMRAVCLATIGLAWLAEITLANAQLTQIERVLRPLPSGTGTLVGIVLTDTGLPAAGATLSLAAPADQSPDYEPSVYQPRKAVADDFGHFTLLDVPEETLELEASMPGLLPTVYGQVRPGLPGTPIRLHAKQRLSVVMRLSRGVNSHRHGIRLSRQSGTENSR